MTALATRHSLAIWIVLAMVGCAQPQKPLYMWESFPRLQYSALMSDGASQEDQLRAMEAHAEKARASNEQLPPGFRAHLGLLYMTTGNVPGARQMWEAEKLAFPESIGYMNKLLKRLGDTSAPAAIGNPA